MTRTKQITLAPTLKLPSSAVTQKIAFLARTGAGKTYAAGRMAEQMLDIGAQVIVVDPVGVWYGLRLKADGKRSGFNIPILGGEHGDIQLEASAGALIADVAVQRGQSMVLDVSTMRKAQATRFVTDFAEQFFHRKKRKKSPVHIIFEEAQRFVPQFTKGKERLVGAVEDIVKVGRNYGIGTTLISQRPQAINKDVLNQTEMLVVLQISGPQERKAIKAWINEKGADESPLDDLDTLDVGHAVIWSPSWLRTLKAVRVSPKSTYDASATPDFDTMEFVEPKPLSAGDLQKLENSMGDMVEAQRANDPKHLKQRIRELEHECTQLRLDVAQAKKAAKVRIKEVKVVKQEQIVRLRNSVAQMEKIGERAARAAASLEESLAKAEQPQVHIETAPEVIRETIAVSVTPLPQPKADAKIKKGARTMLAALRAFPGGLTRTQLATITGRSHKSSTFANYLSVLRGKNLIEKRGDNYHILAQGVEYADNGYNVPSTAVEMQQLWAPRLKAGARRILDILIAAYPTPMDRNTLAERVGQSFKSSTFANYLSVLSGNNLIERVHGNLRASDFIMMES